MNSVMEKEFIDLFELQTRLKEGVDCLFPSRLWVKAEVSAVKARQGGHCWLELSQSNENGLIAKASAVIWSSRYRFIAPYFESVTGSALSEGMVILVEVQPNYSQLYGFSLIINDIDPEYSLGVKELERQRTIERLKSEGLMGLQKELDLPLLPYKLAVVSAEDAAGYRDFVRHLEGNSFGFSFDITLFPALMQGVECPASIISALDAVMDSGIHFDVVLILRGGGSRLDLSCFDDYGLAAVIAQFPLPVMTAIGHDQDFHVCDMVAYDYLKTPTALADELVFMFETEDERLSSLAGRVKLAAMGRITIAEAAVELLLTRIHAADPRKILERGYALVLDSNGVVLKGVKGLSAGDGISVMFPDGTLKCSVDEVTQKGMNRK